MYDHSYSVAALKSVLQRRDFLPVRGQTSAQVNVYRKALLETAHTSAVSDFAGKNPIDVFHLKKKPTYRIKVLADDIVIRKLSRNLAQFIDNKFRGRDFIIANLHRHLEEGVPYRLYRLDIKSFYESFEKEELLSKIDSLHGLSPISKRHLRVLLSHFYSSGGYGIPRGMAISAVLADLMMADFDDEISSNDSAYFYARYVDDIVILTNGNEEPEDFLSELTNRLPSGLQLNRAKQKISPLLEKSKSTDGPTPPKSEVQYLGYKLSIYDPVKESNSRKFPYRNIRVNIADPKVDRAKTRIIRSFLDYLKNRDFTLLVARVKFLTSNFSVVDKNSGKKRLAGIHHSYPLLSSGAETLQSLDKFLRHAVLSRNGRVFGRSAALLTGAQKRQLLQYSFERGHQEQRFAHFSMQRISEIQECWIYE